jgi:stage V sporulation protein B
VFSLADRILGFAFKIYLSRELGATALGIYQIALSVFFVLLTLTTSGVPLIVSKLTAVFRLKKNLSAESGTVSAALIIGLTLTTVVCAAFLIFADFIGKLFAAKQSMTLLLLLLPGVFFSGIYAAFRGNLWGRQRYKSVSAIELAEQVVRIALCALLFYLGMDKLRMTAVSMSAACGFTAIACALAYFAQKGRLRNPKGYIMPLIKQSAPITVIRASNSLVNSVIAVAVPFLLVRTGKSVAESLALFGAGFGMAFPLLYIPITVVGSLAYVLIPTLSAAKASGDSAGLKRQIEGAVSFSIVAASLFVPVFWAVGTPLGLFVYNNADSGRFLAASAWLLIPMSVESITSSMMNSLDLEKSSFLNYAVGSALLFAVLLIFFNSFKMEILLIGLGLSWTVSSFLDILRIRKKTGIRLTFIPVLLKCAALIVPSAFLIKSLYGILYFMPAALRLALSGGAGVAFILSLVFVFGLIDVGAVLSGKTRERRVNARQKARQGKALAAQVKN